ncbi:MAG: branched-chain amino acid transport system substrate-binding protein [Actinomycetota bacterium]|jgi:ABC-type branched-subunit amino acid transport system substrate-binding protein
MKKIERRVAPLLVCLALIAAACGQKPNVHVATTASDSGGGGAVSDGAIEPGDATDVGDGTGGGTSTGGASTGGASGGSTATTRSGAVGGSGAGASLQMTGKDHTGVSATAINLAVHAPVTGAAPLPAESFEKSNDLYWRYVTDIKGEKVLGRSKVNVAFKDDKYTPNTAIQACRELAASSFLLVGAGGTDQIQACAQFAEKSNVPYLSPGVTEVGLTGLKNYFATAMTYPAQTELLAQYVKKNFPGKKVGAIITNTPNFDDAANAWDKAVKTHGLTYYKTLRHPKGNNSWITTYASEMNSNHVEVLFFLSAPVDYIQFAQQAGTQNYHPQYVGVGVSKGLNAVLGAGCPDVDKGIFFSPFPGLDWARKNVPEFFSSGAKFGVPTDDLALALWGLASVEHEMFKRYEQVYKSTDLTREDFVKMLQLQSGIATKSNPQLSYAAGDHFGASQVHVLQADCAAGEHKTLATFASGF